METENLNNEEYHCTECGIKVKLEDKLCPNCGADLSKMIDEDEIKMVVLETYMNEFEAQIAQKKLNSAKINSFISGDNEGGMAPQLTLSRGIRLMVNEEFYDKATGILKDKRTREDYYRTKCQHCGVEVSLNKKEYDDGKYICPECHKRNDIK